MNGIMNNIDDNRLDTEGKELVVEKYEL